MSKTDTRVCVGSSVWFAIAFTPAPANCNSLVGAFPCMWVEVTLAPLEKRGQVLRSSQILPRHGHALVRRLPRRCCTAPQDALAGSRRVHGLAQLPPQALNQRHGATIVLRHAHRVRRTMKLTDRRWRRALAAAPASDYPRHPRLRRGAAVRVSDWFDLTIVLHNRTRNRR